MFSILKPEICAIGCDTPYPVVGKHRCTLPIDMDHGMSLLHPSATIFTRFVRFCRILTLPTYAHHKTRYFYRSRKMIVDEWKRQTTTAFPFVIHPFSLLSLFWEMVMVVIWPILAFIRPYLFAFRPLENGNPPGLVVFTVLMTCFLVLAINIVINFIRGKHGSPEGPPVELRWKKIAIRYLYGYFIFDAMDALALLTLMFRVDMVPRSWVFMHLIQTVRLYTYYVYLNDVGHLFNRSRLTLDIIFYVILHVMTLHWLTCILCVLHFTYDSDVMDYGVYHTWFYYISVLKRVVIHFFLGGCDFEKVEIILLTVTLILGWSSRVIAIGYLMIQIRSHGRCRRAFYTFLREMNRYMKVHKVSFNSNQRINFYVKHKYHGKRYREEYIKQQMSEHLKNEVLLHASGHFICTLNLCKYLKRSIVGELLTQLKPTYFAAGDVLFLSSDVCNTVYFISYGKIACYTPQGTELDHYGDGQIVGIVGLYKETYMWTSIAIDATEAFTWSRADIEQMAAKHPSVEELLHTIYTYRFKQIDVHARSKLVRRYTGPSAHIYIQLGENKILEKRRLRYSQSGENSEEIYL